MVECREILGLSPDLDVSAKWVGPGRQMKGSTIKHNIETIYGALKQSGYGQSVKRCPTVTKIVEKFADE